MKDNIREADIEELSDMVDSITPKYYVKKRRPDNERLGLIAEDLPEIAITRNPDGSIAGYQPDVVTMLLFGKIKKLTQQVKDLEERMGAL